MLKIFLVSLSLVGWTVSSWATTLGCQKVLSQDKTMSTHFTTFPKIEMSTSISECTPGNPGEEALCYVVSGEDFMDMSTICGVDVGYLYDQCEMKESKTATTGYEFKIACHKAQSTKVSVIGTFKVDPASQGQMICQRDGMLDHVEDLGLCAPL